MEGLSIRKPTERSMPTNSCTHLREAKICDPTLPHHPTAALPHTWMLAAVPRPRAGGGMQVSREDRIAATGLMLKVNLQIEKESQNRKICPPFHNPAAGHASPPGIPWALYRHHQPLPSGWRGCGERAGSGDPWVFYVGLMSTPL